MENTVSMLQRFILRAEGALEVLSLQTPFNRRNRHCIARGRESLNQKQTASLAMIHGTTPPRRCYGTNAFSPPPPPLPTTLPASTNSHPVSHKGHASLNRDPVKVSHNKCDLATLIFQGPYPLLLRVLPSTRRCGLPSSAWANTLECVRRHRKKACETNNTPRSHSPTSSSPFPSSSAGSHTNRASRLPSFGKTGKESRRRNVKKNHRQMRRAPARRHVSTLPGVILPLLVEQRAGAAGQPGRRPHALRHLSPLLLMMHLTEQTRPDPTRPERRTVRAHTKGARGAPTHTPTHPSLLPTPCPVHSPFFLTVL